MTLLASEIVYVLSGGLANADPSLSLGGEPSAVPLQNGLNNLFPDVTPDQANAGSTDYRCFYIFNNSNTDVFKSVNVYVVSEISDGANIFVGLPVANESQTVTVSGTYSGSGNFTLLYDVSAFTVSFSPDLATWVSNFQSAIRTIPYLDNVTVVGQAFTSAVVFTINFVGHAGNRSHPLLALVSNTLGGTSILSFAKIHTGSPINLITTSIGSPTTAPNDVTFSYPTQSQPVVLGDLRSLEGFPVWLQRVTPPGTPAMSLDAVKLRIKGIVAP